jgi:hypothetical protein
MKDYPWVVQGFLRESACRPHGWAELPGPRDLKLRALQALTLTAAYYGALYCFNRTV